MKTTAERLSEVYCRPTNEAEWDLCLKVSSPNLNLKMSVNYALGYVLTYKRKSSFFDNESKGKIQIPVQHFIDLIEDKIVDWRLVEDGFVKTLIDEDCDLYTLKNNNCDVCIYIYYDGTFEVWLQDEFTEIRMNVKTYTDLLTLIRLL
jgi:hypothetical protein